MVLNLTVILIVSMPNIFLVFDYDKYFSEIYYKLKITLRLKAEQDITSLVILRAKME